MPIYSLVYICCCIYTYKHNIHTTKNTYAIYYIAVVQSLSHIQLFAILYTAACQASLSFTISLSWWHAQTHVHWVSDAIQSSHPLTSSSPPAFNLSPYQGLFPSSDQSTRASVSASVLSMIIQGGLPLGLTGLISLLSKGLSVFRQIQNVISNGWSEGHDVTKSNSSCWTIQSMS